MKRRPRVLPAPDFFRNIIRELRNIDEILQSVKLEALASASEAGQWADELRECAESLLVRADTLSGGGGRVAPASEPAAGSGGAVDDVSVVDLTGVSWDAALRHLRTVPHVVRRTVFRVEVDGVPLNILMPQRPGWRRDTLQRIEEQIAMARKGDPVEAARLLGSAADCLEHRWHIPEPLREYLIRAFREIDRRPGFSAVRIGSLKDLQDHLLKNHMPGDANKALNIKRPKGRRRPITHIGQEWAMLALGVHMELHKRGATSRNRAKLDIAIGNVADRMGAPVETVRKAWREFGKQLEAPEVPG